MKRLATAIYWAGTVSLWVTLCFALIMIIRKIIWMAIQNPSEMAWVALGTVGLLVVFVCLSALMLWATERKDKP